MKLIIALLAAAAPILASCASVQLDPQKTAATTLAPFTAKVGINDVRVPEGSPLVAASLDGKPAFCTVQPAWFAIGEARSVCFTDEARTGYLDHYYVLGTLRAWTFDSHIPYIIGPNTGAVAQRATDTAAQHVDVDWNRRGLGEGSNAATERAIEDRCKNMPETWHCSDYDSPEAAAKRKADLAAAQVAAEQLAIIRAKQDAGKKLTSKEATIVAMADADDASARLAAQTAQAQATIQQAEDSMRRQAAELAHQQKVAACTAAADAVALSIRSFWGGLLAGTATGAACMSE